MNTDDLIERLARQSSAVTPLPAPGKRVALWLGWAALYLAVVFLPMGAAAMDAVGSLYVLQQAAAMVMALAAANAALTSVIPGLATRAWTRPVVGVVVWTIGLLLAVAADMRAAGMAGLGSQTDWPCVVSMTVGGVVVGAPLVWMLRNGAPLTPRVTAALTAIAALGVTNIAACLTRPHAFAITVLVWHGATLAAVAVCAAMIGRHWFRWPETKTL